MIKAGNALRVRRYPIEKHELAQDSLQRYIFTICTPENPLFYIGSAGLRLAFPG